MHQDYGHAQPVLCLLYDYYWLNGGLGFLLVRTGDKKFSGWEIIQMQTSAVQSSITFTASLWELEESGLKEKDGCKSSACACASGRSFAIVLNSPEAFRRNKAGPKQLPWGMPQSRLKGLDNCCLITVWLYFIDYSVHYKSRTVLFLLLPWRKIKCDSQHIVGFVTAHGTVACLQLDSFVFFKCYGIILSIKGSKHQQIVTVFVKTPLFQKYSSIAFWRFST